jgi:hypothetical protein
MSLEIYIAWIIMFATGGLHAGSAANCDTAIKNFVLYGPTAADNTAAGVLLTNNHTYMEAQAADYPSSISSMDAWAQAKIPYGIAIQAAIQGAGG